MAHFGKRDVTYSALDNELTPPLAALAETTNAAPTFITLDHEHEDANNVIIHKVPKNKGGWTHIEDLDSFFTRMYRYYVRGGFYPMIMSDLFYLLQFIFIVWFSTFLVYCVNYTKLFRNEPGADRTQKISLNDVILPPDVCVKNVAWKWWCLVALCAVIWLMRLIISIYHLYYAYDTKLFYNNALKIKESDLVWINWSTIQDRVREAQPEHHMCVHKQEINELDIYHRILRFTNYMVAMVNKNLLPLQIHVPCIGDFHYLSRGLRWNIEFLLFYSPWSPWENCWQLRACYKDHSKRMLLARQLERQILWLAIVNLLLAPLIQAWQILYFFFNYAEITEIRMSMQKHMNVVFLSASILGVLVVLSVYDEDVLTVEHVLSIITILGCVLAAARALIGEEERLGGGCTGPARGEELFVQVYILFELLSPLLCPLILFSLRSRALDIVDFYRNFTVSVLGIGDVCSFAQLDIRRHGHPDWHTPGKLKGATAKTQYDQGEGEQDDARLVHPTESIWCYHAVASCALLLPTTEAAVQIAITQIGKLELRFEPEGSEAKSQAENSGPDRIVLYQQMQRAAADWAMGQRGGRGHSTPPPPITPVLTVSAWCQISRLGSKTFNLAIVFLCDKLYW
ncbi:hypothetical protein HF086_004463 [Spodoptera exigua]|uniref:Autophagy-related protein 9 n=1 Tax=Spodoptera exigua TaxID=7107 RepID=A0A922M5R0_SPOEX|nr:hypothetical protein HF086_004463 [Spodoptera exigua]